MNRLLASGALAAALTILLAGCGKPSAAPQVFDRQKTRACLASKPGVRIGGPLDFVASTATGGAFQAKLPGNAVTIAFGQTLTDADNIDQAYIRFHARNVGIGDVLRQQGNVVMLWHQHPEDPSLALVLGCLTA